jgi:hypothetical protein
MIPVSDPEAGADVIVLERWVENWAPAFQFDADGHVANAVADVNRLLDAESDPWGVASWWLTPHASLCAIPADAIRVGKDEDVLAAANAVSDLA